eukprot:CAMPEP_0194201072 /NCGR_PEP_ID=MMETSP0156-20130528/1443_1 /TAXON_ID=33649 /ORGANISM="Thalassionema nitzschioides, Strain L26-B" /LENGTH=221 /DNA_ID=CAMNT_0038926179 /DNA_START=59 /DNA_END=721 /DNA_ORIENTATION=-
MEQRATFVEPVLSHSIEPMMNFVDGAEFVVTANTVEPAATLPGAYKIPGVKAGGNEEEIKPLDQKALEKEVKKKLSIENIRPESLPKYVRRKDRKDSRTESTTEESRERRTSNEGQVVTANTVEPAVTLRGIEKKHTISARATAPGAVAVHSFIPNNDGTEKNPDRALSKEAFENSVAKKQKPMLAHAPPVAYKMSDKDRDAVMTDKTSDKDIEKKHTISA